MTRARAALALLPFLLLAWLGVAPATAEDGRLCRAAIRAAERERALPAHLLAALARVGAARRDPETGALHPWPWTIHAEGHGQFFPSRAAAIAAVQALQARGVRGIAVGCLQVDLRHHPDAFASLEEAFDPAANAAYAAGFLAALRRRLGDWPRAAAAYGAPAPETTAAYRTRVMAAWAEEQVAAAPDGALATGAAPVAAPPTPRPATLPPATPPAPRPGAAPEAGGGAPSPGPAGPAGRGLEAYRSLPVPIAGRSPVRLSNLPH